MRIVRYCILCGEIQDADAARLFVHRFLATLSDFRKRSSGIDNEHDDEDENDL